MNGDRRGFTLTELIVVTVLGALLIMAAMQILITNQRTYSAQSAQIQGQQTTRAALDLLSAELREISARGGDIISMSGNNLTVRSMRKFGVVCSITATSPPVLRVVQVGDWFEPRDSVFVFADNQTSIATDDEWISAQVTGVDTTVTCGTSKAQNLSFSGQGSKFTADSVRTGAPLRSFVRYRYGLVGYGGSSYLGRTDVMGNTVPLVGPLKAITGLSFRYLDSLGNATGTNNRVRQILVTIRTESSIVNSLGQPVSDSISAIVYTRN